MDRRSFRVLMTVPLLFAAPTLAGCSGSSPSSTPSASAPATAPGAGSAPAPGSAPSSSGTSPAAATPTPSGISSSTLAQAQRKATKLCTVISVSRMNQLLGSNFGSTSGGENGLPCSYTAKRGSKVGSDVGAITAISARTSASLQQEATTVGAKYGLTRVKPIEVPGASAAYSVTGTYQGVNAAVVVAEKDGIAYDALFGGSRSSSAYAVGLVKVVHALITA